MISRQDRKIMEAFEEKYTPEDLLNTIDEIKKKNNADDMGKPALERDDVTIAKAGELEETSIPEALLFYIKKLEGYRIRLKESHWSTKHKAEHDLTDNLISKLLDYEDEIAENSMGVFGIRIKAGDIVPEFPPITENTTVKTIIDSLTDDTLTLLASLELDEGRPADYTRGILAILEDVVCLLNKSKYLSDMI